MPNPTASGIEWQTRNGSTVKTPAVIASPLSGSNSIEMSFILEFRALRA